MAGTPFEVGDAINLGARLAPGVPAHVAVTVRVYPLDGSDTIERSVKGDANANGYFQPDEAPLIASTPGEYVIDYQARYSCAGWSLVGGEPARRGRDRGARAVDHRARRARRPGDDAATCVCRGSTCASTRRSPGRQRRKRRSIIRITAATWPGSATAPPEA